MLAAADLDAASVSGSVDAHTGRRLLNTPRRLLWRAKSRKLGTALCFTVVGAQAKPYLLLIHAVTEDRRSVRRHQDAQLIQIALDGAAR